MGTYLVLYLQVESSVILYGSGVKSVQVVLSELSMRLFDLVQTWMLRRHGCICAISVCMSLCVVVIVMLAMNLADGVNYV